LSKNPLKLKQNLRISMETADAIVIGGQGGIPLAGFGKGGW